MLWKLLDRYPTLPNGTREGWIRPQSFQRIGPARTLPPIPGKRLADTRSIQVRGMRYSKRSSVARTRPSPGFFSRSDRSVFFPDGRLYQYACRRAVRLSALRFGTRRSAEAATLQLLQFKGARTGHCFAITMSERRSGAKHDNVIRVPPAETLVQANALGAHVAVRTSQRGSQNSDCRVDGAVRGDAYARAHKVCAVLGARCSGCLCVSRWVRRVLPKK